MAKWRVESRLGELVKKEKEINGESDTRINYKKRSKRRNTIIESITDKILLVVHFIITLAPLIVTVAFIGWILYAIFWSEDPYEKYHDDNPYNQDWNGDGIKGTKEDQGGS
ncbi:hypothetical protein [Bacillus cytotoxicus]|uniref:hypothetical protein n=1 Tax=Bacillus cytotoxicus TaxID=580165 RepID=UPI00244A4C08|nr:hypothetical protein [Bacillus cytotoxicus]MDH2882392.1 hypothetical protein [Bacillus cytotoxicus]